MPIDLGPHTCAMCPKMCRFACPVARAKQTDAVHPTGLATAVLGGVSAPDSGHTVYDCTMCLGCNSVCVLDQDVPAYIRRARAEAVALRSAPEAVHTVGGRAAEFRSPYRRDPAPVVGPLIREALQTERPGRTDVAYVPSCTAVARRPAVAHAVVAVLQSAGVGVRVVHPGCCGAVFRDLGLEQEASALEEAMLDAIERSNADRVVTDGPVCARALGATPFAVVAAELLDAGRLNPRTIGGRATYHDPCVLARGLGVHEEPRRIVRAVFDDYVELPHCGLDTRCSGGGGGLPATDASAAEAVARERLAQIASVSPDVVVTACVQAARQLSGGEVPVRDIAEILAGTL